MRQIALYLHGYFLEQRSLRLFLSVGILLGVSFTLNYGFYSESLIVNRLEHPLEQLFFYFLFFGIPYFITLVLQMQASGSLETFRDVRFVLLSLFAIAMLATYIMLHNLPMLLYRRHSSLFDAVPTAYHWYLVRYASNLVPGLVVVPVAWYWYKHDRADSRFYGFSASNINLKTYFAIILLLAPVILAASFTSDFLSAYPRFRFGLPQTAMPEQRLLIAGFEFCYGVDFVFVELFFRGFLVMAIARHIGSGAILPMVVVYAFIHFQKPIGEALSSILGGLVLGVISYRTKSIYGGIILHLGVAFMMEIAGALHFSF